MTAEQKALLDTLASESSLVVAYVGHIPISDASVEYAKQAMTHAERVRDALQLLVAEARRSPCAEDYEAQLDAKHARLVGVADALRAERAWRERVETLLSDCYAQLDAVFDEALMRRINEELRAAELLAPLSAQVGRRRAGRG